MCGTHLSDGDMSATSSQLTGLSSAGGAVLLAAGFSRRFGSVKLAARLPDGDTLFARTLHNLLAAAPEVIVVGRAELAQQGVYEDVQSADPRRVKLVMCSQAEEGMGRTLATGASHIPAHWPSCLICLADMPYIATETYRQILRHCAPDNIVIPSFQGRRGHPIGFGQRFFEELQNCHGDTGARNLLSSRPEAIRPLPVNDPGILQDIDQPDDLA